VKQTTNKFKLPKLAKAKWIKALRSGKYKQGEHKLKYTIKNEHGKNENRYCCLGVACELGIAKKRAHHKGQLKEQYVSTDFLPYGAQLILARMNDSGLTFKKIAAWIQKKL
jgi:hypothetical protein